MNKALFLSIVHRLSTEVAYFQPTQDATGRSDLSPFQKCTATIRQLAYGGGADTVDEYVRLGETTARKCLHEFSAAIINLFGDAPRQLILKDYSILENTVDFPEWLEASIACIGNGRIVLPLGKECIHEEPTNQQLSWRR